MKKISILLLTIILITLSSCSKVKEHDDEHIYIEYGTYAQTMVEDEELKETLELQSKETIEESKKYKIEYNGDIYIKFKANLHQDKLQVQNENIYSKTKLTLMTSGSYYYFRVEPIKWRVVEETENTYTLLCDEILFNHEFDGDSNDFDTSTLKTYLNTTFISDAFNDEEKNKIVGDVSILKYENLLTYFTDNECRRAMSSDYARANELKCDLSSKYYGYTTYYVDKGQKRVLHDEQTCYVDYMGAYNNNETNVNLEYFGIRPIITINK